MKVQMAVLAQSASVDKFTNRLSIFNVIENIISPNFPLLIPDVVFVALVQRSPEDPRVCDGNLRVTLGDTKIGEQRIHLDFENAIFNRQIMNFRALPVSKTGDLCFELAIPGLPAFVLGVPVSQAATDKSATT